jgi:hypothetical protein
MGRSVYEQPGTKVDGILSQQGGFQVSKGKRKGGKREWEKKQKARGLRHNTLFIHMHVHNNVCNCVNGCQLIYVCIIIARYQCG